MTAPVDQTPPLSGMGNCVACSTPLTVIHSRVPIEATETIAAFCPSCNLCNIWASTLPDDRYKAILRRPDKPVDIELLTDSSQLVPRAPKHLQAYHAQQALIEFQELFFVTGEADRITLLTFFTWCRKWEPLTGYGKLLRLIIKHYGTLYTKEEGQPIVLDDLSGLFKSLRESQELTESPKAPSRDCESGSA